VKRALSGTGRDPLLLFLLAAIGAAEAGACGGISDVRRGLPDGSTPDGEASGAAPAGGVGGAGGDGGTPATSGRSGGYAGNSIMLPAAGMGSSAGGMGSDAARPPGEGVVACAMPTPYPAPYPLPDPPPETGFFLCSTNTSFSFIHRAVAEACPTPFSDPGPAPLDCASENYCSDVPHGRCLPGNSTACRGDECFSECKSDSDCASNELCLCDDQINHCVPARCRSDAECGPGLLCITTSQGLNGLTPFTCQNSDDECTSTCANYTSKSPNGATRYMFGACILTLHDDGSSQRDCTYSASTGGSCGRPFLVEGAALTAEAVRRNDWAPPLTPPPDVVALTPELRRALAASWLDAALMEHASIAAFARFSLELLALGAPPDLLRDAAQAMSDEQRHAELCFGLASAYAGEPLGPGALDVRRCLQDVALGAVLVTTFLEGCLGETLAAVEARERAHRVQDPVLEAALHRIAEDEARHAALAWRFVKWALGESGAGLEDALFAALETERARVVTGEPLPRGVSDEVARAHGLLSPAERARLRRETLDEIAAPCLLALCPPRASGVFHEQPAHLLAAVAS